MRPILRAPFVGALAAAFLAGCTLAPSGTREERARLDESGAPYAKPFRDRVLPELPTNPTWKDVLERAFLANGDLEAAYFEWKAAVERIDVASAWPNSRLTVGYSYAFSSENLKAFDRSTFSFGADAMENLQWPSKIQKQGQVALDQARTTGARFRAAKFDLQKRVLSAWADYTVAAERARVQAERMALAQSALEASRIRAGTGGMQQDLLRADLAVASAEDEQRSADSELASAKAALNGMLLRDPRAELSPPAAMPEPRPVPSDDATLLAAAVDQNPELQALAQQVQGRTDALELARLQWLPDINPTFAFTGSVSQAIGAAVVLPTTVTQIRGTIKESAAMLQGSEATLRQARSDRAASFVATLLALRNSERQAALFESRIVPAAERLVTITRQSYAAGVATYLDMIESQRTLLDARLSIAEARASREKRLAELEALMGTDVETLGTQSQAVAHAQAPAQARTGVAP